MGNCIDRQKAATWVVDDDESGVAERPMNYSRKEKGRDQVAGEEEKGLLEGIAAGPVASSTELKVKISKKQLEELLKKIEEGKGVPIQQVLTDLLNMGDDVAAREHEQHWRPSLQSIPEFPE